jgi:methionyl-tRNA formyltransferase
MPSPLQIVFMGTAELACPSLEALVQCLNFRVVGVVTQPDRPKERNLKLTPSPVKALAVGLGLPLLQPERIRHEAAVRALADCHPDLIVVAAYSIKWVKL